MEDGQKFRARSESRRHSHGVVGANGTVVYKAHGGAEAEKKECLFLTNEATKLLKTKRRRFCCHRRWRDEPAATPGKTQKRAK